MPAPVREHASPVRCVSSRHTAEDCAVAGLTFDLWCVSCRLRWTSSKPDRRRRPTPDPKPEW